MKFSRRFVYMLVVSGLVLLLFACTGNERLHDLEDYIIKLKNSITASKKKIQSPVFQIPNSTNYKAQTLRSPFDTIGNTLKEKSSPSHPLQGYSLNMLRFVGTIVYHNNLQAFVQAPDNKIYQVKIGDVIGDHYGKITKIEPKQIEIVEQGTGDQTSQQRIVILQPKD